MRSGYLKLSAIGLIVLTLAACATMKGRQASSAPPDFKVVDKFHVGGTGRWDYLNVDPQTQRLYVTRSDRVMVLNAADGKTIGTIPDTKGVHGVALVPELNRGFASDGGAGTVTVFDLKTLATLGVITAGKNPDCIIYDPASKQIFAFNGRSHSLSAFPAAISLPRQASDAPIAQLPLGGKPEYAVADGSGQVFVNIEDTGEVVRIDSKKLEITARWPLAPGQEPTGLAMDVKNRRLFVGCDNRTMVVLDADNGNVVATLPIGQGVDAVAFDPGLNLAMSSNGQGDITVVREDGPDQFSVQQTVPTAKGARTMALDPTTHRIYLATAEFGPTPDATPDHPHPRPDMAPDSFVILVVEP